MTSLRIFAVDDEPLALRRIVQTLREIDGAQLVGTSDNCADAVAAIANHDPDVLLLDVRLRDGDGFDILESVRPHFSGAVIFVTAFDDEAAKAFDAEAVDYVLKPLETDRLKRALVRARNRLEQRSVRERIDEMQQVIANLRAASRTRQPPQYRQEFWVRRSQGLVRVSADEIEWAEVEGDYVSLHAGGRAYLVRGSISRVGAALDPERFARVHRRTLVRLDCIAEFDSRSLSRQSVQLRDGTRLPVGRIYAKELKARLNGRHLVNETA